MDSYLKRAGLTVVLSGFCLTQLQMILAFTATIYILNPSHCFV